MLPRARRATDHAGHEEARREPRQASRRCGTGSSKSAIDRQRHEEVCHCIRKQIERWADIQGKHVHRTLHLARRYNGFTSVYCAVGIRIIDQGGLHGLHPGGIALLVCKGNGTLREAHLFSCRTETHLEYRLSHQRECDVERVLGIVCTSGRYQGWEDHKGKIGYQVLGNSCRMANGIPENIAIGVRTDGARGRDITAQTGVSDIGQPKVLGVGGQLLETRGDVQAGNMHRKSAFKML